MVVPLNRAPGARDHFSEGNLRSARYEDVLLKGGGNSSLRRRLQKEERFSKFNWESWEKGFSKEAPIWRKSTRGKGRVVRKYLARNLNKAGFLPRKKKRIYRREKTSLYGRESITRERNQKEFLEERAKKNASQ